MKKFEAPSMELMELEIVDLITTSGECVDDAADCDTDAGIFSVR